jgi:integrase/recombinase XerD
MSNAGIPLRVIADVSGHRVLSQLQSYLEIQPEQVLGAVSSLSMLSPVREVGKIVKGDIKLHTQEEAIDEEKKFKERS